jgi:hypothetical protein
MLNFWTSLGQLAQISEIDVLDDGHNRGLKDLVAQKLSKKYQC